MGVVTLPDWGAQLGHALAQLGSGAANIANPHHEFQEKFREAITADSSIMQRLADLTLTNGFLPPGIARLIPRDLQDAIFSMEASPEAHKRKAAVDAIGNFTSAERVAFSRGEALGMAPSVAATELAVAHEIPRVAQQAPGTVPTTLAELGAQRRVGGGSPGAVAADILTAKLSQPAQDWLAKIKQYDAEHGTDYYQRTAAEHFSLLDEEQNRLSMADRILLLNMHQQDRIETIQIHEADSRYNQSGSLGSPELWRALLYDPKTQRRVEEIRSTGAKTAEDRDLLRMENYRRSSGERQERASYINSVVTRDMLFDKINGNPAKKILPDDDTRRPGNLAALNAELIFEHTPFEAYWGTSPDGSGKTQLRFRSRLHKNIEVPPDQVFNGFQQADRVFDGSGLSVEQPKPEGAAGPKPKPPAQVTHSPVGPPPSRVTPPAINPDTLGPADLWEYLKRANPQLPDSVITSMVRAKRGIK